VGESYLIVDSRRKTDPYRVVAVPDIGAATAQTGWCKTRGHCERTVQKLTDDGYEYMGELDPHDDSERDLLNRLRISVWSPSDLKSMIQKYVRRGDPDRAVDAAYALMGTKDGEAWLTRRLPILACEDNGWEYLPDVVGPKGEDALFTALAGLARVPGSHEAGHLNAVASEDTVDDPLTRMWKEYLYQPVQLARELVATSSEFTRDVLRAVQNAQGYFYRGGDRGMLVAAGVLAIHKNLDGPEFGWPDQTHDQPMMPVAPDWWSLDSHSSTGRIGVGIAAKKLGVAFDTLANVMFFAGTFQVAEERDVLYDREAKAVYAKWCNYGTWDLVVSTWSEWEPVVREAMEGVIARRAGG
jgi:hypothetical protein